MNIIAFDPGKSGGIAFVKNGVIHAQPMPIAGKELDLSTIVDIILFVQPEVGYIEKVHSMPGQGVSSTFTFGVGYGQLQGLLMGRKIPFELVAPQAWKKTVLSGTTKDKSAAITYCRRVFPDVPLVMPRCRTPHDGIADALCILQHGIRVYSDYPLAC